MTYRVRPALECCHICPNQDTGESEATLQLSSPGIHPFNFETGIRVLHCNYWLQILVTLVISTWTKPDAKSVTICSTTFVCQNLVDTHVYCCLLFCSFVFVGLSLLFLFICLLYHLLRFWKETRIKICVQHYVSKWLSLLCEEVRSRGVRCFAQGLITSLFKNKAELAHGSDFKLSPLPASPFPFFPSYF